MDTDSGGVVLRDEIETILHTYDVIGLKELDSVGLLNRVDHKHSCRISSLPDLLKVLRDDYLCLEINGKRVFHYDNTYFDNSADEMYHEHMRGKSNRYKVRVRSYDSSDSRFLEVKRKDNKGRIDKRRLAHREVRSMKDPAFSAFIGENTPYHPEDLSPKMQTSFDRITLVNKDLQERCTIDLGITLVGAEGEKHIDEVAILEVKTIGHNTSSPIFKALRSVRDLRGGFSKYCLGRSLLDPGIKNNNYRAKIRSIEQLTK